MDSKIIEFDRETIRSRLIESNYSLLKNNGSIDIINDRMIHELTEYIYVNNKQKKIIEKEEFFVLEPPKFFDWLFKKKKTIYKKFQFVIDTKDILLDPPLMEDENRILRFSEIRSLYK